MNYRKQNSTSYPFCFYMVQSSDHLTGATDLTITIQISKNGGAFAVAAGAVSQISGGWYSWAGNATDRNTLGELSILISASGADTIPAKMTIVTMDVFDANLGLQALPAATAGSNGGLPTVDSNNGVKISSGTGTGQISLSSGLVTAASVVGSVGSISGVTFPTRFANLVINTDGRAEVDVQTIGGQDADQNTTVDANIVSINGDTFAGANVPSTVVTGGITAASFASNSIDSSVLTQNAADKVWSSSARTLSSAGLDNIAVENINLRQAISLIAAALCGKVAGADGFNITISALNAPSTTRIAATVDSSGNRTTLTLSPPS